MNTEKHCENEKILRKTEEAEVEDPEIRAQLCVRKYVIV